MPDNDQSEVKQPRGLMSRQIFNDLMIRDRMTDITLAIDRYAKCGMSIPSEWTEELRDLALTQFSRSYTDA